MKVLFVCRGNIGRSQMAEVLFNKMTGLKSYSAGTKVTFKEHLAKRSLAEPVIRFMKKEGIDISKKIPTQLTETMLNDFDKIIVMAEPKTIPSYLYNNPKAEFWKIADPKGMDDGGFEKIISQIKHKIKKFIKNFSKL